MEKKALPTPLPAATHAPQPRNEQIVQFEGFRCMAYLDDSGKWRASFGGQELKGFVSVAPNSA
jgi:hypothetical protein